MFHVNSKMKLVFMIYQAIIHSCRSEHGYHYQYSDYESQYNYIPNPARRAHRNLQTRFVTVHRPLDDIGRSGSIKNGSYTDENVIVVPYPVPVLIFPMNKPKSNKTNSQITSIEHSVDIIPLKKSIKKPVESSSYHETENPKQETDELPKTTLETEVPTQLTTETAPKPTENTEKIEENIQKHNEITTQFAKTAQKSAEVTESTQKFIETDQGEEEITSVINEGPDDLITTTQLNYENKQTNEPAFTESNIRRTRTEATFPFSLLNRQSDEPAFTKSRTWTVPTFPFRSRNKQSDQPEFTESNLRQTLTEVPYPYRLHKKQTYEALFTKSRTWAVTTFKFRSRNKQTEGPEVTDSNTRRTRRDPTFSYSLHNKQSDEPAFTDSNTIRTHTQATLTHRPLNSNANYNIFHRDKGPPHLGDRRPKRPPGRAQRIRLRPTKLHKKVKTTTETDIEQIRRRRFNMPKFGLVQIPNDLANKLRPQLQMNRNVI